MKIESDYLNMAGGDSADVLLQRLLHLKKYEAPDAVRMTKHRQNIMRQVREANSRTHWSLGDLLELNIPWFFAEPRYGIAALFVVFAGLQFWGANSQKQASGRTGIYTSNPSVSMMDQNTSFSTNHVSYPKLPDNLQLFPGQRSDSGIKFVGRLEEVK